MDWDAFEQGLGLTLPMLEERTRLTISWSALPTVYVQAFCTTDRLWVGTGALDVVGYRVAGVGDVSQMEVRGWQPPQTDPLGSRVWWTSLGFPSRSADYDRLAGMCVGILRDVRGVPSPVDLEYRAERDAEDPPENELFYEEDLEPAVAHLVFDQLGISDANPAPVDS